MMQRSAGNPVVRCVRIMKRQSQEEENVKIACFTAGVSKTGNFNVLFLQTLKFQYSDTTDHSITHAPLHHILPAVS